MIYNDTERFPSNMYKKFYTLGYTEDDTCIYHYIMRIGTRANGDDIWGCLTCGVRYESWLEHAVRTEE